MYYSPPLKKKHFLQASQIPTSAKTKFTDFSPRSDIYSINPFQTYTPKNQNITQKIYEARQDIDELIYLQKHKKNVNNSAINHLYSTNRQVYDKVIKSKDYTKRHYRPTNCMENNSGQQLAYRQRADIQKNIDQIRKEFEQIRFNNERLLQSIKILQIQNNGLKKRENKNVPSWVLQQLQNLRNQNQFLKKQTLKIMNKY